MPSDAWRERQRLPEGMLFRILEARHYWQTKMRYDARGRGTADAPLMALVKAIDLELVQDARAAREAS